MRLFLEFFIFELKFRFKSISTYVYFGIWLAFSFLCIASENFGPIAFGNGKVLLNGPYANIYNDVFSTFFGLIIIGAIFGTSILRDFQRDTTQILFTKPISKFAYLGGRWAGSFVATAFAFSGLVLGELLGTLAPWADHTRIAPTHLWWYLQPFLFIILVQIFFIGSIFFMVAALSLLAARMRMAVQHLAVVVRVKVLVTFLCVRFGCVNQSMAVRLMLDLFALVHRVKGAIAVRVDLDMLSRVLVTLILAGVGGAVLLTSGFRVHLG